jgi:hypothetical protein
MCLVVIFQRKVSFKRSVPDSSINLITKALSVLPFISLHASRNLSLTLLHVFLMYGFNRIVLASPPLIDDHLTSHMDPLYTIFYTGKKNLK